jgi:hypothetical protein
MVPGFLIWLREPLPLRQVGTLIEGAPGATARTED